MSTCGECPLLEKTSCPMYESGGFGPPHSDHPECLPRKKWREAREDADEFYADMNRIVPMLEAKLTIAKEALGGAIDLAEDLRGYTRDWDWKWGGVWEGLLAQARQALKDMEGE